MLKLLFVVGARPNFMKVAPLVWAVRRRRAEFSCVVVHTGQHYDAEMSETFFRDLDLPAPAHNLEVGSASHARQTAEVMLRFEPVLVAENPDWVVVVGDVNSTLACALTAVKLGCRIAHVEAGLRSRDRSMPEEINRLLTDQIADLLLTPSEDADKNLIRENIPAHRICFVGNVMVDALRAELKRAAESDVRRILGVEDKFYGVVTLHRPSNTDDALVLVKLIEALDEISRRLPLIFPVHPRTRNKLEELGRLTKSTKGKESASDGVRFIPPLGYLDFLHLTSGARIVLTDSGGLQEETTALGVPCLTLRDNTERPATVRFGTNRIVGTDPQRILSAAHEVLDRPAAHASIPPLWDGKAADRILDALKAISSSTPTPPLSSL